MAIVSAFLVLCFSDFAGGSFQTCSLFYCYSYFQGTFAASRIFLFQNRALVPAWIIYHFYVTWKSILTFWVPLQGIVTARCSCHFRCSIATSNSEPWELLFFNIYSAENRSNIFSCKCQIAGKLDATSKPHFLCQCQKFRALKNLEINSVFQVISFSWFTITSNMSSKVCIIFSNYGFPSVWCSATALRQLSLIR